MKTAEKNKNPLKHNHAGHRERMKGTARKKGFSHMHDHELLELLLFYAIPRRDTNQLAHELIEQFGSLNAVLEADVDRIAACSGMGESSAVFLKAILETVIRYVNHSVDPIYRYDHYMKVSRYLCNYYVGQTREESVVLLFDNKMRLLDTVSFGEGSVTASPVNLYRLTENIFKKNAAAVIIAHNHLDGIVTPSYEDCAVTRKIYDFLKQMSIPLLEHVIVSGKESYPIIHYSGLYDVDQIAADEFGEEFFHRFLKPLDSDSEQIL